MRSKFGKLRTWAKPTFADAHRQRSRLNKTSLLGSQRVAAEARFTRARGTRTSASPPTRRRGHVGEPWVPPRLYPKNALATSYHSGGTVFR